MTEEDNQAIAEVMYRYVSGWRQLDTQTLKGIWDQAYSQLTYKPVELEQPLTDWRAIEKYYDDVARALKMSG